MHAFQVCSCTIDSVACPLCLCFNNKLARFSHLIFQLLTPKGKRMRQEHKSLLQICVQSERESGNGTHTSQTVALYFRVNSLLLTIQLLEPCHAPRLLLFGGSINTKVGGIHTQTYQSPGWINTRQNDDFRGVHNACLSIWGLHF
jgi:hypothetical protein